MAGAVERIAPSLRVAGIEVERLGRKERGEMVRFSSTTPKPPSPPPAKPLDFEDIGKEPALVM
jgi:hypothetical protein